MWWVGSGSQLQPVEGGRTTSQWCESCEVERTFVECVVHDQLSVTFVPVLEGKIRRFACSECGHDIDPPPPLRLSQPDPYRGMSEAIEEPHFLNLELRDGCLIQYTRPGSRLRANVVRLSDIRDVQYSGPVAAPAKLSPQAALLILFAASWGLALLGSVDLTLRLLVGAVFLGVFGVYAVRAWVQPGPHLRVETATGTKQFRLSGPVDEAALAGFLGYLKNSA